MTSNAARQRRGRVARRLRLSASGVTRECGRCTRWLCAWSHYPCDDDTPTGDVEQLERREPGEGNTDPSLARHVSPEPQDHDRGDQECFEGYARSDGFGI